MGLCCDYHNVPWVITLNVPWYFSTMGHYLEHVNIPWIFIRYRVNFRYSYSLFLFYFVISVFHIVALRQTCVESQFYHEKSSQVKSHKSQVMTLTFLAPQGLRSPFTGKWTNVPGLLLVPPSPHTSLGY